MNIFETSEFLNIQLKYGFIKKYEKYNYNSYTKNKGAVLQQQQLHKSHFLFDTSVYQVNRVSSHSGVKIVTLGVMLFFSPNKKFQKYPYNFQFKCSVIFQLKEIVYLLFSGMFFHYLHFLRIQSCFSTKILYNKLYILYNIFLFDNKLLITQSYLYYKYTSQYYQKLHSKFFFYYFFDDITYAPLCAMWQLFYHLELYLNKLFQIPVKQDYIDAIETLPKKIVDMTLWRLRKVNWRHYGLRYANSFIYMCMTCFYFKNIYWFALFIRKKLNTTFFKQHKRFFKFFFSVFLIVIWAYRHLYGLKGFFLQFRGKLARGGDTRKSSITYKRGVTSLIRKNLCIQFNKWGVWTKTGSIGCIMHIYY